MKKIFSSRAFYSSVIVCLLIINILLIAILKMARAGASEQSTGLKEKERYYHVVINQLMGLNVSGLKPGELKLCIYLNLSGCDECNDKTLEFARAKFSKEDLCIVVDEKYRNNLPPYLKEPGYELYFEKESRFFESATPFFFINIHGNAILKFTHDNDHPELSDLYFDKVANYLKIIRSNV